MWLSSRMTSNTTVIIAFEYRISMNRCQESLANIIYPIILHDYHITYAKTHYQNDISYQYTSLLYIEMHRYYNFQPYIFFFSFCYISHIEKNCFICHKNSKKEYKFIFFFFNLKKLSLKRLSLFVYSTLFASKVLFVTHHSSSPILADECFLQASLLFSSARLIRDVCTYIIIILSFL